MRIPSLNSNVRFTNWKSQINLKFNSILFCSKTNETVSIWEFGIFLKIGSYDFFFVGLYLDGMRFSKKNSQIKIFPRLVKLKIQLSLFLTQKMKTGNGLLQEKRRQRIWKPGINGHVLVRFWKTPQNFVTFSSGLSRSQLRIFRRFLLKAIKTCSQMQEYLYRPPDYCAFIRDKFVDNEIIKKYELSLVAHV